MDLIIVFYVVYARAILNTTFIKSLLIRKICQCTSRLHQCTTYIKERNIFEVWYICLF